jgi:23S rRNA (adenine2503-C2)-methyltransferase
MKIIRNILVPTGNILIVEGRHGELECLSLGDYGKEVNLNQHRKVLHTQLLPFTLKWVCTISTQYGCSMHCKFCDVPKVGAGINASLLDMLSEVSVILGLHPDIGICSRFNLHYARMGEPTWNFNVIYHAIIVKKIYQSFNIHPVVSTMMPKGNKNLDAFLRMWCHIKNDYYDGDAGLQISVNSTDASERESMFSRNALPLDAIAETMQGMPDPIGRKYTLNFAIAGYKIDAARLARLFPPSRFVCKLTPMHKTSSAIANHIKTDGDYTESYPYEQDEAKLKAAGFETLVFIASKEEDESRITCGNAIFSDRQKY